MGYGPFNAGGSASGLDAYTKTETQENFLQRYTYVKDTDADTATNEGIYHYGGAAKNFYATEGTNVYGRLLVFNSKINGVSGESQTWLWQIALATYPKEIWWRNRVNTENWSSWRRITDHVDYDTLNNLIAGHTQSIGALNTTVGKLCDTELKEHKWDTTVKCATWSRLCLVEAEAGIVGSSFILNVSATRNNTVYNETFAISVAHPGKASIVKLSTAKYSSIGIRCTVNTSGRAYVELYDNANNVGNGVTQTVKCRLVALRCGTVSTYSAFTDGTTLADGFSIGGSMTVDKYDLQSADGIANAAAVNGYTITAGTAELTAGVSTLATGTLYLMYK